MFQKNKYRVCKQFRYLRILTQGWKCLSWKLFRSSSACRIFANVVLPDFGILLWKINRGFGSFGPGWISLKFTFKVSTAEWRICFNPNTNGFSLFFAVPIPSTKLNIIKLFLAIDIIFLKWILEILGLLIYEIVLTSILVQGIRLVDISAQNFGFARLREPIRAILSVR